jgi:hypothetical protein
MRRKDDAVSSIDLDQEVRRPRSWADLCLELVCSCTHSRDAHFQAVMSKCVFAAAHANSCA